MPPLPPHDDGLPVVPGFLLGAPLGGGSSASVWRATPLDGGPVRALKVVATGPGSERELGVLAAVRHPHVVQLHDSIPVGDGRVALVLDLVDGGTLGSVVAERGHLSPGEVVTVIAPLAQALAQLHADGVQHGDLAPGNVLLDRTGRPVLSDLGTTRVTGEPRDEVFGTAGYVDPVVLTGGPASPASDVYGLGALGWLALTGAPPPSPAQRPPLGELVPAVPAALVAAVEAAVDPDPLRRPDPAGLARQLLLACPARPVWAAGEGPESGGLTHRIRALAAADAEAQAGRRHRAERRRRLPRPTWRPRRVAAVAVLAVTAALVGAAVVRGSPLTGLLQHASSVAAHGATGNRGARHAATPPVPTPTPVPASPPTRSSPAMATPSSAPTSVSAVAPTVAAGRATAVATPHPPGVGDPPTPGNAERPTIAQVQQVVSDLSRRRAAAFAEPARRGSGVTLAGSPAATADRVALAALRRDGVAYRGLRLSVHVSGVRPAGDRVVVEATTRTSGYDVVDRSGAVVRRVPETAAQPVRLVLARVGTAWRVEQVRS